MLIGSASKQKGSIGYFEATAIGIGGMVGGGIFAVLGLAVGLAGGGTPVAFAVAGVVAAITSYSYAKLSVKYPSAGGTVEFLYQGFGPGLFTGGLNVLLWVSYFVMICLYAYAFGSYASSFFPAASQDLWRHVFASGAIILFTGLNAMGAAVSGKAEEVIVGIKLLILIFFVAVGLWTVQLSKIGPSTWPKPVPLLAGGMIIFVAYEGFELIANTAEDVRNPKKTLPRAFYSAVGFVIVLYILVAMITVGGGLSTKAIMAAKDYALAEAAKPFLGQFGFVLIAIAALLATSSAINATFYGTARISYVIAKDGELPKFLEKKVWNQPIEGLLITAVISLLMVNLFDLSSIATMGSAGFLIIFAAVNASNFRLHSKTGSNRWVSGVGCLVTLLALLALLWQTATTQPEQLLVLVVMVGISFAIEFTYRKITGRSLRSTLSKKGEGDRHGVHML